MKPLCISLVVSTLTLAVPALAADVATDTPAASAEGKAEAASLRASKILGANVKNKDGESVGEVKDMAIDPVSGKVRAVIVSTGGFLGMADTLTAVTMSDLAYDREHGHFTTSLSKEEIAKLDQYKESTWSGPDGDKMFGKLREARDAVGGDVDAPDNTAQNEKDIKDDRLTPVDQGNSDADIKLTRDIRSAVVGTDLSFNAKNIKIITKDGVVTLRGVVEGAEEKEAVLEKARTAAGSAKINDELTVKGER